MSRVTSVIIARDEERNIARCIHSVRHLGPVIVSDSGSTDRTREIAADLGADVRLNEWRGFGLAKQAVSDLAVTEYILSIDADEVVSDELAQVIQEVMDSSAALEGYYLPRVTDFCGSWVFHSGWYPDHVLRLYRKSAGKFTDDVLHESVRVNGNTACLTGWLLHYSYPDMKSFTAKLDDYARLGSRKYRDRGGKFAALKMLFNPPVWFFKKFIIQRGFADGVTGLWIAVLTAVGQFLKYRYALTGSGS